MIALSIGWMNWPEWQSVQGFEPSREEDLERGGRWSIYTSTHPISIFKLLP